MAKYPTGRIEWLLGISDEPVHTPTTLTSRENNGIVEIYSYGLCIGFERNDGSWWIHDRDNSETTNRHIDALSMVIGETHERRDGHNWYPKEVTRKSWGDIMNGKGSKT